VHAVYNDGAYYCYDCAALPKNNREAREALIVINDARDNLTKLYSRIVLAKFVDWNDDVAELIDSALAELECARDRIMSGREERY